MSDHHVIWSSHQWWPSLCWSYLLYDSRSTFRSPVFEAMFVHARLVKFNPSIPHVQNCLAPIVCKCRAYHTQSTRGVSAHRIVATVHAQGEHLYLEILVKGSSYNVTAVLSKIRCIKDKHHTCNQNMWHDMAIIILCFWSPSPKHCHDLHLHRLDTLISIIASCLSRQLLLLQLSLPLSCKVKQLHGVCIPYNNKDNSYGSCRLSYSSTCKSWFLLQEHDQSHTSHIIHHTLLGHITSHCIPCKNKLDVL